MPLIHRSKIVPSILNRLAPVSNLSTYSPWYTLWYSGHLYHLLNIYQSSPLPFCVIYFVIIKRVYHLTLSGPLSLILHIIITFSWSLSFHVFFSFKCSICPASYKLFLVHFRLSSVLLVLCDLISPPIHFVIYLIVDLLSIILLLWYLSIISIC